MFRSRCWCGCGCDWPQYGGKRIVLDTAAFIRSIYAGLGEKDKAFEFLEKAYQERSPDIPYFLKADLRIDNLRSDPRFQDLLRRVGLPQ
jgi:hypothetical protein